MKWTTIADAPASVSVSATTAASSIVWMLKGYFSHERNPQIEIGYGKYRVYKT